MNTSMTCLKKENTAIDIVKLVMAFLVVAIHTEPFGFSNLLDNGFGIFTRMCVPFFFVASSYFFFTKNNDPVRYVKRLFLLYLVWSVIYLPLDIPALKTMTIPQILVKYFWTGNGHALWYLCGSIIGFLIVFALSKVLSPRKVFVISVVFLTVGCLKSTYAPIVEKIFSVSVTDHLGSRNGLFYGFAYYALGLLIAKNDVHYNRPRIRNIIGFLLSFILLGVESAILVLKFNTQQTILWFSVLPMTYSFFMIVKSINFSIKDHNSRLIRKMSTLIYVSHCMFQYLFVALAGLNYWRLFLVVSVTAVIFSVLIIFLVKKRWFRWMKILY